MKKLILVALMLAPAFAFAEENPFDINDMCRSLAQCLQLRTILDQHIVRLQDRQAEPLKVIKAGEILTYADGTVRPLTQQGAINYCASIGMHLPTARELARRATGRGALGISVVPQTDYYLISAKSPNEPTTDNFYFNYNGYSQQYPNPQHLYIRWTWSSSAKQDRPPNSAQSGYILYEDSGVLGMNYPKEEGAVRCVRGL